MPEWVSQRPKQDLFDFAPIPAVGHVENIICPSLNIYFHSRILFLDFLSKLRGDIILLTCDAEHPESLFRRIRRFWGFRRVCIFDYFRSDNFRIRGFQSSALTRFRIFFFRLNRINILYFTLLFFYIPLRIWIDSGLNLD